MSEQVNEQVLPAETPFVTVAEAKAKLTELANQAPAGGSFLGVTITSKSLSILSTPDDLGSKEWRIGVVITIPRFANALFGQLASWGLPGSERKIQFVVKAEAEACTVGPAEGGPRHKAHSYTVMNGAFQMKQQLSTEMERSVPFRDPTVRKWYGITYSSTKFEELLQVVRSEITGEPAFPELTKITA